MQLDLDRKKTALLFVLSRPGLFRADFAEWLETNWPLWEAFERQSNKVYLTGRKNYSARTIIEWMRHETLLAEVNSEFKINNNFAPDLARLYIQMYPSRAGFFELRHSELSLARAA